MSGYRLIHRALWDSDDFREQKFSEREAFIWIFTHAAHKAHSRQVGSRRVMVERGQIAATTRSLSRIWQWSEPAVRRYLKRLSDRRTLETKTDAGVTQITVCNFDHFQAGAKNLDAEMTQEVTHSKNTDLKNTGGEGARKTRTTTIPDDWVLPEKGWEYARKKGWTDGEIRVGAEHFAAHHGAKGSRFKDWHKAWTTWVLNERKYGGSRSGSGRDTDPYLDAARDVIARDTQGRSAGRAGEAGGLLAFPQDGSDGPVKGQGSNVIELQPVSGGGALWGDDGASEPQQGHAGTGEGAGECVFAAAFRLPGGGG